MKNEKIEVWNGHEIRFVEKEAGDWWAIANDVAYALEYDNPRDAISNHCRGVAKSDIPHPQSKDKVLSVNVINEVDIYRLIFGAASQSKSLTVKQKAEEFEEWVFGVIKTLRQASGLESFHVFRMLDKEHQREAMKRLHDTLYQPVKVDYIKANTVTDKAVSNKHGFAKMVKKGDMTPEMLADRQPILEDVVSLMAVNEKFGLNLSVSKTVYNKYH